MPSYTHKRYKSGLKYDYTFSIAQHCVFLMGKGSIEGKGITTVLGWLFDFINQVSEKHEMFHVQFKENLMKMINMKINFLWKFGRTQSDGS